MISLGTDLVAGKNRVPNPATGKIAFVTLFLIYLLLTLSRTSVNFFANDPLLKAEGEENWASRADFF